MRSEILNKTIQTQLDHRTIRFFKDQPITAETLTQLFEVMNRTATSSGLQTYSVMHITDQHLKNKIAEVCKQDYVKDMPVLLIFLVDVHRNAEIAKAKGYNSEKFRSMNHFFQGVADVYLAAQNLTNAVESIDLGAVFLGSVLNDAQKMVDILNLPELTFPLVGMGFGYPNDAPELKPRMDLSQKIFENTYPKVEDYLSEIADYDQAMTHYYDTRENNRRSDSFSDQVVSKFKTSPELRSKMLQVVAKQGFDLGLD